MRRPGGSLHAVRAVVEAADLALVVYDPAVGSSSLR